MVGGWPVSVPNARHTFTDRILIISRETSPFHLLLLLLLRLLALVSGSQKQQQSLIFQQPLVRGGHGIGDRDDDEMLHFPQAT